MGDYDIWEKIIRSMSDWVSVGVLGIYISDTIESELIIIGHRSRIVRQRESTTWVLRSRHKSEAEIGGDRRR